MVMGKSCWIMLLVVELRLVWLTVLPLLALPACMIKMLEYGVLTWLRVSHQKTILYQLLRLMTWSVYEASLPTYFVVLVRECSVHHNHFECVTTIKVLVCLSCLLTLTVAIILQLVNKMLCDSLEETVHSAVWRSAIIMCGEVYVMTCGEFKKLRLSAGSQDLMQLVSSNHIIDTLHPTLAYRLSISGMVSS